MYRLTYQDSYQVERTLEFENYEELMLSLSGCVTLPDTFLVTSLTFDDKVIYHKLIFKTKTKIFLVFSCFC